jgi:hypothetical protein
MIGQYRSRDIMHPKKGHHGYTEVILNELKKIIPSLDEKFINANGI